MTTFRHKCPPEVNPKTVDGARNPSYAEHIRKEYEVSHDAEWHPIFDTGDASFLKMGHPIETGREMAFVTCPDCGFEVVVTRTAGAP